ncbi:competence type IV pilus ATPase ComGA [Macrococcus sp. DPC7161]|uniref:competence type IV pilus ATPase ComGA n=1 Tax=Macrococcus sp. DPC7161 TaxID=2507060 RepID=UPI00100BDF2A|nr:competence type IV pilus ATPase ComGA [Macrococcus sp. DPC7161]RXK19354.1 type II/IV secretion system protein [Macrococcus sp. DPC7161]
MEASLNKILLDAIQQQASDIHFVPCRNSVLLKLRILGDIELYDTLENDDFLKLLTYIKYICKLDVSERNKAQSGVVSYHINDAEYQLRASTLPQSIGVEALVIRMIPVNFKPLAIHQQNLYELIKIASGLLLISGPTGSGKSTLMYTLLDKAIHQLNRQVITIEDPVEQTLEGAIQINVNHKANITYKNSLKAILRCDPDIIMIGEIRDEETAKHAISASLSGHLVIATIHASDAVGVVERLLEMGIQKNELLQSLHCIINQRLIRIRDERTLIFEILYHDEINKYMKGQQLKYDTLLEKITMLYQEGQITKNEYEKYIFEKAI